MTIKRTLEEVSILSEKCFDVLANKLPQKEKDLGSFKIPYTISGLLDKKALAVLTNMLVKVDKFSFLVDFAIIDLDDKVEVPLILGRPFLATS